MCPKLQIWIMFECIKENESKAKIAKKKKENEFKDFLQIQFYSKLDYVEQFLERN